jgi:NAD(P)-dependent dehydrogenase (short-subunit alcohol dehydrogenase family)
VGRLDGKVILSRADVRDRDGLRGSVAPGVAELGRLDIVCANPGIMPIATRALSVEKESTI